MHIGADGKEIRNFGRRIPDQVKLAEGEYLSWYETLGTTAHRNPVFDEDGGHQLFINFSYQLSNGGGIGGLHQSRIEIKVLKCKDPIGKLEELRKKSIEYLGGTVVVSHPLRARFRDVWQEFWGIVLQRVRNIGLTQG